MLLDEGHDHLQSLAPPSIVSVALEASRSTHGVSSTGVRFARPDDDPGNNVHSGDQNTSLGNTGDNGSVATFAASTWLSILTTGQLHSADEPSILRLIPYHFRFICVGDDFVGRTTTAMLHGTGFDFEPPLQANGKLHTFHSWFEHTYRLLGHKPEVVSRGNQTEMCSALFVPADVCYRSKWYRSYKLSSKPGRLISRLGYALTPQGEDRAYIRGVAVGMNRDCHHMPLSAPYTRAILRLTKEDKAVLSGNVINRLRRHQEMGVHGGDLAHANFHTWQFIDERYGFSRDDAIALQDQFKQVKQLPAFLASDLIRTIVEADVPLAGAGAIVIQWALQQSNRLHERWTQSALHFLLAAFDEAILGPSRGTPCTNPRTLLAAGVLMQVVLGAPILEEAIKRVPSRS